MAYGTWVLFLVLSLAAVLTPGPAMLAIFGHALSRGSRLTLPVVLGNAFGAVLLIGASVAGLSVILASLPHGFTVLKWAGAAYLLWLGIHAWRGAEKAADRVGAPTHPGSDRGAFGRGVLIALSIPRRCFSLARSCRNSSIRLDRPFRSSGSWPRPLPGWSLP